MTPRLDALVKKVRELYEGDQPKQVPDNTWLYHNHVFLVAEEARRLAEMYGGSSELAYAAGLLHDVADAVTDRFDPAHKQMSLSIAKQLLAETGFREDEIKIVVDDALQFHSCRGSDRPQTKEGIAMTAADAVVHLNSDFYPHFWEVFKKRGMTDEAIRASGEEKLARDFNTKIPFDDLRESLRPRYESLREKIGL